MCPLCKTEKNTLVYDNIREIYHLERFHINEPITIVRCEHCGIVFTEPRLSFEALGEFYSQEYGPYLSRKKSRLHDAEDAIKQKTLEQWFGYGPKKWWGIFLYPLRFALLQYPQKVSGGKLLDVGCGAGAYIKMLERLGWQVYGVDPSPLAVQAAKESGLKNMALGSLHDAAYPDCSFDVVILSYVLEHVPDPPEVLHEIKRILKPGGTLIVSVPNFGSPSSRTFRQHWSGLNVPIHFFHYEKPTLLPLLSEFDVEKISYNSLFREFFGSFFFAMSFSHAGLVKRGRKVIRMVDFLTNILDYAVGNFLADMSGLGSQIIVTVRKRL